MTSLSLMHWATASSLPLQDEDSHVDYPALTTSASLINPLYRISYQFCSSRELDTERKTSSQINHSNDNREIFILSVFRLSEY